MHTAEDLMTENPVAVRATSKVRDAVEILQTLEIRHLPVVNENQELIGMLSDRDLRSFAVPQFADGEWVGNVQTALDARVSSLMSGGVLCVDLEADPEEIVDIMLDYKVGAVPVVDGDGKLAGIVSYVDLLRELPLGEG
jgi:acetoin utilization protein AcuB